MSFEITNGNDLIANSGDFNFLTVNGVPVSTGVSAGGSGNVVISNSGLGRLLASDGTSSGIIGQSDLIFNSGNLAINGVIVNNGNNLYMWSNFR